MVSYNWYAVNDPRGLAPVGWHVPSYNELTTLQDCLGGFFAGGKMKATTLWNSPNTGATNESGFTGVRAATVPATLELLALLTNGATFEFYGAHFWRRLARLLRD